MRREVTLEEISDGKLYDSNDMVKADSHNCEGCCDCCQGMGDSVILDPFDVHRLSIGLKKPAEQLLQECLELALTFYLYLNDMDGDFLDDNGYSREEVLDGMKELASDWGVTGLEAF